MYRIGSAAVIFIITVTIVTAGFLINTRTASQVTDTINSAVVAANNNDTEKALSVFRNALDIWKSNNSIMLLFMSHGKIDQIDESVNIACTYIENGDLDMFRAESKRSLVLLRHFNDLEYPSFTNIL